MQNLDLSGLGKVYCEKEVRLIISISLLQTLVNMPYIELNIASTLSKLISSEVFCLVIWNTVKAKQTKKKQKQKQQEKTFFCCTSVWSFCLFNKLYLNRDISLLRDSWHLCCKQFLSHLRSPPNIYILFHLPSTPMGAECSEEIAFTQLSHSVTTWKILLSSKNIRFHQCKCRKNIKTLKRQSS